MPLERYLIRPATQDDDTDVVRALLEPVDFLDPAMPEEIVSWMRPGWRLPVQYDTALLLIAQEYPAGPVVGHAHTIPPVQWLLAMEAGLGRKLCLMLARTLTRCSRRGRRCPRPGPGWHRLVSELVRRYTSQEYEAMLGGIHSHRPHLARYYETDGFSVLPPGAPLDLQLPLGRIRYAAEPSTRHLVRPLAPHVSYRGGVLHGLLTGR